MKSSFESERIELKNTPAISLPRQAASFFVHALVALGAWVGLMLVGYALKPMVVAQWTILLLSIAVPLTVGWIVMKIWQNDMATAVWLLGVIWVLVFSLYVLDLPTGPNQCFQCTATEKLTRTFLDLPKPSGLIDDDGPFLSTWPAAALVGYSFGAWMGRWRRG